MATVDRKSLKPGDWIEVRDPSRRISYGQGGRGAYKVVKVGRVNVIASIDVRFSPTGPWHHQEHKIPLEHVVRVIPPDEMRPETVTERRVAARVRSTRATENRKMADDKEIPIANPGDYDDDKALFQFQFGAYADTKVYVWADSADDAFEIAVEWADDNAKGIFTTVDEDDLKEAAEDLGIKWQPHWPDWEDRKFEKVAQKAEADLTVIGWTTLNSGTHVISYEIHFHEVTDKDEIADVAAESEDDDEEGEPFDPGDIDKFTRAYFETALWSSNDESDESGGEPLDKNYDIEDFSEETGRKMIEDAADFQERYADLLADAPIDSERAGHNFWLSRNGHGAGFFDDNLDELQKAAESYGEFNLYVDDDGQISGS